MEKKDDIWEQTRIWGSLKTVHEMNSRNGRIPPSPTWGCQETPRLQKNLSQLPANPPGGLRQWSVRETEELEQYPGREERKGAARGGLRGFVLLFGLVWF